MNKLNLTSKILKNHEDFIEGKINYLPFNPLGKFTEWFPGIMRGDVTGITGTPASSKTSLSKFLIEHSGIPWAVNNNKNFKVIRFNLEESQDQYGYSLLSYRAWRDHGLQYNIKDFISVGRTINRDDLPLLQKAEQRVDKMFEYIECVDTIYNSWGIWKYVRDFASKRGKFYLHGQYLPYDRISEGWDKYVPDDPDEFIVIVVDNLSYIVKSKDEENDHKAIWNTVEYLRKYAANKLNYSVVFLQHQDATSENQESRRDHTILPTEQGLAKNKEVRFAYLNLIGIANPNKVNVAGAQPTLRIWDGYDLTKMGNYLRTINILKSRFGESNVHSSTLFTGRTGWFDKLPVLNTPEYVTMLENLKTYK